MDKWKLYDEVSEYEYWEVERESRFYSGRNYWLFYFLAGVRDGEVGPISPPKGVPEDASDAYNFIVKSWMGDGHSHSYFTLTELLNIDDDIWDKIEAPEFRKTLKKMKELDSNTDNVRACFFFDN